VKCEVIPSRGTYVIVCGGRRRKQPPCHRDGRPASVQCDFVVAWRDAGVAQAPVLCSRWCCTDTSCSVHVGPDRDFCRQHYDQVEREKSPLAEALRENVNLAQQVRVLDAAFSAAVPDPELRSSLLRAVLAGNGGPS